MCWNLFLIFHSVLILGVCREIKSVHSACNLKNGQCVYDTQLGQEGQCDSVPKHEGGGHFSGPCTCDDVWSVSNQMKAMKTAENDLKHIMAELQQHMDNATSELNRINTMLGAEQQNTSQLKYNLNTKEVSLNQTKGQLDNILQNANTELNVLRGKLASITRNLTSCQTALGTPVNTQLGEYISTFQ